LINPSNAVQGPFPLETCPPGRNKILKETYPTLKHNFAQTRPSNQHEVSRGKRIPARANNQSEGPRNGEGGHVMLTSWFTSPESFVGKIGIRLARQLDVGEGGAIPNIRNVEDGSIYVIA
jgi:hypothetical protein